MSNIELLASLAKDKNILVVEDHIDLNEELTDYFSIFFGNTKSAFDGKEGLQMLSNNSFDVVLSDISMPNKNGLEMIEEFKLINSNSKLEFIVLSGHINEYKDKLESLNVKNYFLKPLDMDQLTDKLINLLS